MDTTQQVINDLKALAGSSGWECCTDNKLVWERPPFIFAIDIEKMSATITKKTQTRNLTVASTKLTYQEGVGKLREKLLKPVSGVFRLPDYRPSINAPFSPPANAIQMEMNQFDIWIKDTLVHIAPEIAKHMQGLLFKLVALPQRNAERIWNFSGRKMFYAVGNSITSLMAEDFGLTEEGFDQPQEAA